MVPGDVLEVGAKRAWGKVTPRVPTWGKRTPGNSEGVENQFPEGIKCYWGSVHRNQEFLGCGQVGILGPLPEPSPVLESNRIKNMSPTVGRLSGFIWVLMEEDSHS